jgi:NAD(P)-dependent dehydrogenase (short-subunit alcohol dehydrogenase family)
MNDIFNLDGKVAVVIGGGGGIGQAIAKGLAFYGAKVTITGRTLKTLENAAAEIKNEIGKTVVCRTADVECEESITNLAKEVVAEFGTVDILVNSQGLNKKSPTLEVPLEDWDKMFSINVRGVMIACRVFGKIMIEKRAGKIINVSSIRGIRALIGGGGNTPYGTTKGAVDMLTKSLAAEWAQYNVQVNGVGPVITETPMMVSVFEQNPALKENILRNIPMGRIGLADDNIGPAVFLASEASNFVTGQIIYPDGGSAAVV